MQYACARKGVPAPASLRRFAQAALAGTASVSVGLRIVDDAESAELNQRYRGKPGPTNVLSFPYAPDPRGNGEFLGDLVLCAPLVRREARAAGKPEKAHWAHLVVHGILHLRGYDHIADQDARIMEARESEIMEALGFPDPYLSPLNHA